MTILDSIGNVYVGNCIYSNADINYPTTNYFQAEVPANWSTEINSLFTSMGVGYSGVSAAITSNGVMFKWTPVGDTTANATSRRFEVVKATTSISRAYNNAGVSLFTAQTAGTATSSFYTLCGNAQSLSFFNVTLSATKTVSSYEFFYQGVLQDVNTTGSGYYSGDIINKSLLIYTRTSLVTAPFVSHYIAGAQKIPLSTGKADYFISCVNLQTPDYSQGWGTDFWVFDNNADLSYPVIGRASNLVMAVGTDYVLGKPCKFGTSQTMPDGGFNSWLPVSTFANKTLLMRCYSSSIITI